MPKPDMKQETMKPEQKQSESPDQTLYDIFVAQGIRIAAQIASRLQGKASIDVLGNALYETVNKIESEGSKHGINFPLSVLLHGSNEILGHLIDVSEAQIGEEQIKAIIGIGVGKYLENAIKTGKMTPEQIQDLAKQAQQSMPQQQEQTPAMQPQGQPQMPMAAPGMGMGGQNG
jgi:hypothetical protein